jgi:protein-tyrosine phosphatase
MAPRTATPIRVLFVCLGNVCRSPSAAAVMRRLVDEAGLSARIEIDSAGVGGHFTGKPPDPRARDALALRGVEVDGRARQVTAKDFERFDHVLAMDPENLAALELLRPRGAHARVRQLLAADAVPDPFYGGEDGFEYMLDLIEVGAAALLERLRREHGL